MRVGINTGEMVTGNMGSKQYMNYTMMGEVVNLAARLESGAKLYGVYFLTTYDTLVEAGIEKFEQFWTADAGLNLEKVAELYHCQFSKTDNLEELRHNLFLDWNELDILGRVYLASEGINAQISVPKHNLNLFKISKEKKMGRKATNGKNGC